MTTDLGRMSGSADPEAYAERLAARLSPVVLPHDLGTPAGFDFTGVNGRALTDDVVDVMLSLMTNTAPGDGVRPDPARTSAEFPYLGPPVERR